MKIPAVADEFKSVRLNDTRLVSRLLRFAEACEQNPGLSFPKKFTTPARLEGSYRFGTNPRVVPEVVGEAHFENTVARSSGCETVLVAHDTTEFEMGGDSHREGLGRLTKNREGFLSHHSFALAPDGRPLGSLAICAWARGIPHTKKLSQKQSQENVGRESLRWAEAVELVEERLHGKTSAIHLMDREGDSYELLAELLDNERRFVIRVSHDRRLDSDTRAPDVEMLFDTLGKAPWQGGRNVLVNARTHKRTASHRKTHPPRQARWAQLRFRAERHQIFIGNGAAAHLPPSLTLNFVEVLEVAPPEGATPIHWRLMTSEPIDSEHEISAVIDAYRHRWLIEEFFKALKTGCNYEKLQFESAHALAIALAVYSTVAWRMLLLRWMATHAPEEPASSAISPTQLTVLRTLLADRKHPLPKDPTATQILYAVAGLAGHIKNNGPPGWSLLSFGFERLLALEAGFLLARNSRKEM